MEVYPILSEAEIEAKPIFNSLQEALEDTENAYSLELIGEEVFPDELGEALKELPRLQVLVIHENPDLNVLPPEIGQLRNLQYLEVRDCPLQLLPSELGQCRELTGLVLADLPIFTGFPEGLEGLTKLNYVEVTGSVMTGLPAAIAQWKLVEELNVSGNRLGELPDAIGGMESLQTLRTYHNYAMYVPASIKQLKNLIQFDHGDIDFRDTSAEEVKAALPNLVMDQVSTQDRIRPV